jgi:hypothetical protein
MFNAPPEQKINPLMYVDSLTNQIDFYVKNNIQIPSVQSIAIAAAKDSQQRDMVAQLTKASGVVSGLVVLAATAPSLVTWALTNPDKAVQTGLITVETAAAIATGAITPTSVTEAMASTLGRQLTAGEQTALQQFTAVLKAVNQQKVLALQEARLGELVQMFKRGSTSSVTLDGQLVALEKTNASGTTKLLNTSAIPDAQLEKQVFDYASELSGGLSFTPHPTSAGVWYSKLTDGTTINVRNVSSSNVGRWTIDVQGNPRLQQINLGYKKNSYEIKLK